MLKKTIREIIDYTHLVPDEVRDKIWAKIDQMADRPEPNFELEAAYLPRSDSFCFKLEVTWESAIEVDQWSYVWETPAGVNGPKVYSIVHSVAVGWIPDEKARNRTFTAALAYVPEDASVVIAGSGARQRGWMHFRWGCFAGTGRMNLNFHLDPSFDCEAQLSTVDHDGEVTWLWSRFYPQDGQ